MIIADYVARQHFRGKRATWTYEAYLSHRNFRKQVLGEISANKPIEVHTAVPLAVTPTLKSKTPRSSSPPPYQATSPMVRPQRHASPQSYRTTYPSPVDSIGVPYVSDFKGGLSKISASKSIKSDHRTPTTVPEDQDSVNLDSDSLAERWYEAESSRHSAESVLSERRKVKHMHHVRYDVPAKARTAISSKYVWDGMRGTFDQYKTKVEGHLMQVGAGYLINDHFLKMYKLKGFEYLVSDEFWTMFNIGIKQAQYDRTYFYGIIVSTNTNAYNKSITKHRQTQDGILTWSEFLTLYAHDGSKELKIEQLEDEITKSYDPTSVGGMAQYIDKFQDTMERLDTLSLESYSDAKKKYMLLKNVRHVQEITHLYQHCKDSPDMSYEETAAYLRSNSILIDSLSKQSKRPTNTMLNATLDDLGQYANNINHTQLTMKDAIQLVNTMTQESSLVNVYQMLSSSKSLREKLHIHPAIWRKLDLAIQKKILDIKNEIQDKEKAKHQAAKKDQDSAPKKPPIGNSTPSNDTLPSQYPTMKGKTPQMSSLLHLSAVDLPDSDEDTDDDMLVSQLQVRHVSTIDGDMEIRAHLEYSEVFSDKVYAISDGGADSCVLGKKAKVLHYTGRHATLVGYDPKTTRTPRIPIVTAYIKVMSHVGIPVFLKINEAPYHSGNPITLLSEYQVREHHYIIDSVAEKHLKAPGVYGMQRLNLSDILHVKFEDRGGIMGFEMLDISDEDFHEGEPLYDVFEITGSKPWVPRRFQQALTSVTDNAPETENQQQDPEPSKHEPELYFFDPEDMDYESSYPTAKIELDIGGISQMSDDNFYVDEVDAFLAHLTYDELLGNEPTKPEYYGYPAFDNTDDDPPKAFDSFAYATKSWHRVLYDKIDPKKVQPYLGFCPLDIVKATLRATTQLAWMVIRYPMTRHYKARAPWLNVVRLDEGVSTDSVFVNCPSLHHGYSGFQPFFGMKSKNINPYGFRKQQRHFPTIYRNFIREHGAPSTLRRDCAMEEQSEEVMAIHRDLYIKDEFSEPYNQQQNPVESQAVKWLKHSSHVVLDKTGAPEGAWYFSVKYLSDIHNICYDKALGMSPLQF